MGLQQRFALRGCFAARARSQWEVSQALEFRVFWVPNYGCWFRPKTDQGTNKEYWAASMAALNLLGRRLGV